ncbi:recombinase family protein [Streptomyces sp. NPDC048248]|uniref:recombinase family protein n=1 Tax=Streptomyces sp. NPDC048248 TaxID=3365523 RepID=UPI003721B7F2
MAIQTNDARPIRAALYTRISNDPTGRQAGVKRQEADCRALTEGLGWEIVTVHRDNDLSAYSGKPRPGYRALLEDLRSGRVNAIVAWHSDRLYRRLQDLDELVQVAQEHGTEIRTCRAGIIDLSMASGVLTAEIQASVAKHEVAHAIERMVSAKAENLRDGLYRGGPRPFGYEADGVTIRPSEQQPIEAAMDAIIAGDSLRSVCRRWEAEGIRTVPRRRRSPDGTRSEPIDHEWKPTELRRMLLRARNAGFTEHHGQVIGSAVWPPLVSEEKWRAVKAILENPTRRTTTGNARSWLGSGLYMCGVCRDALRCSTSGVGGKTKAGVDGRTWKSAYRCRSGGAKHVVRDSAHLDKYVEQITVERLSRPDATTLLRQPESPAPTVDLPAQANALRAKLDAIAADYADDLMTRKQMIDSTAATRRRLVALEVEMTERASVPVLASLPLGTPSIADLWPKCSLDRKRAIVDALMTVTVNKAHRGRPRGYRPGVDNNGYFDPAAVEIEWKR